jgi:sulfite dehydrogenase (quinone) subunit SoeC
MRVQHNEFLYMNPAYSVILFTTASGAGYGLLAWLGAVGGAHGRASTMGFAFTSVFIALALITTGLLSSTFHLGRPERAWRAFSQWRSSWLSREGVAAILTYPAALAFGTCWSGLIDAPHLIAPLGYVTAIMCAVTVFCTAQIYASLKTIRAWNHSAVPVVYILFAAATGAVLLSAISTYFVRFATPQYLIAALLLAMGAIAKLYYWNRIDNAARTHTMAAATGLGEGVRQWEVPHTSTNYLMKEMGYVVARRHGERLRKLCLVLLVVAFALMLLCLVSPSFSYLAVPIAFLAAWVERWLFFAQAEHVVGLFYGKESV